jgi:hypothetical protein
MFNSWSAIFKCLQCDGEAPKIISLAMEFSSIPSVKISMNSHSLCSWTPLHECDIIIWLQLKAKLLVRSGKLQNTALSALENVKPLFEFILSQVEIIHMRFKIWVVMNNLGLTMRVMNISHWLLWLRRDLLHLLRLLFGFS